jgi:hypothetical protein
MGRMGLPLGSLTGCVSFFLLFVYIYMCVCVCVIHAAHHRKTASYSHSPPSPPKNLTPPQKKNTHHSIPKHKHKSQQTQTPRKGLRCDSPPDRGQHRAAGGQRAPVVFHQATASQVVLGAGAGAGMSVSGVFVCFFRSTGMNPLPS